MDVPGMRVTVMIDELRLSVKPQVLASGAFHENINFLSLTKCYGSYPNRPHYLLRNSTNLKAELAELAPEEQKYLLLLHGAHKCHKREAQAPPGAPKQCYIPQCQDMRRDLKHLMSCPSGRKCSWPADCSLLRQKVKRLTGCTQEDCPICVQKKEWHMALSEEQRSQLIDLLIQTTSNSNFIFFGNPRYTLHEKVLHTQALESQIYIKADNLTDYYRMMAAKKWEMEMSIEERQRFTLERRIMHRLNRLNRVDRLRNRLLENMGIQERRRRRRGIPVLDVWHR